MKRRRLARLLASLFALVAGPVTHAGATLTPLDPRAGGHLSAEVEGILYAVTGNKLPIHLQMNQLGAAKFFVKAQNFAANHVTYLDLCCGYGHVPAFMHLSPTNLKTAYGVDLAVDWILANASDVELALPREELRKILFNGDLSNADQMRAMVAKFGQADQLTMFFGPFTYAEDPMPGFAPESPAKLRKIMDVVAKVLMRENAEFWIAPVQDLEGIFQLAHGARLEMLEAWRRTERSGIVFVPPLMSQQQFLQMMIETHQIAVASTQMRNDFMVRFPQEADRIFSTSLDGYVRLRKSPNNRFNRYLKAYEAARKKRALFVGDVQSR